MILPTGSEREYLDRQNGFTLLELLTVILIMSMVVGFSVPRFSRSFNHLQVQVFTNDVAKLLTYASRRAVTKGEVLSVHFDTDSKRYWVTQKHLGSEKEASTRIFSKLAQGGVMPDSLAVKPSLPAVTFYPDGRADSFELVVVDQSAEGYRLVTDMWTGRAKISETHGH